MLIYLLVLSNSTLEKNSIAKRSNLPNNNKRHLTAVSKAQQLCIDMFSIQFRAQETALYASLHKALVSVD